MHRHQRNQYQMITSTTFIMTVYHKKCTTILSDLGEVVQPISLSSASLQVSQFQLQCLQAAGTQGAAEQLQEQRAGHHTCQLVQQPLAT